MNPPFLSLRPGDSVSLFVRHRLEGIFRVRSDEIAPARRGVSILLQARRVHELERERGERKRREEERDSLGSNVVRAAVHLSSPLRGMSTRTDLPFCSLMSASERCSWSKRLRGLLLDSSSEKALTRQSYPFSYRSLVLTVAAVDSIAAAN